MSRPPTTHPRTLTTAATIALIVLVLPLAGMLQRVPWSTLVDRLTDSEVTTSLRISLVVSLWATGACVLLGLPLAWFMARVEFRGKSIARAVVMLPMVLPPVVAGTALLFALGRRGLIGQRLDSWFGISLPFTTAGAVVAATFVALPFFVTTVESGLRQHGLLLDEAAAAAGAGPIATFIHVTVPSVRSSIGAGAALSWARALGEFGATVTFAGNLGGRTRTLPLATFLALENDPASALAISVLLMAVSLIVLVALRGRLVVR